MRFYRELAVQQGWRMKRETNKAGRVDDVGVWVKTVEGTTISFGLHADRFRGRDVYIATIIYDGIGTQR